MPALRILLNAEGIAEGIPEEDLIHIKTPITVAPLDHGMASGAPSVAFLFELPDGKYVLAETSLKLFQAAYIAFKAKFGDLLGETIQ